MLYLRRFANVCTNCIWVFTLNKCIRIRIRRTTLKKLKGLKIEDMLKLQELQFYFKYIHKQLFPYLLNWQIIPSINIHNYKSHVKDNT